MGAHWLSNLPDVIAGAGLDVDVWPGWESRARSSGGYDQVWAVFVHHTASSTSPQGDMAYMWDNAEDRPIGAIYLARDGQVTVGAAGATNCQGKGGPYAVSAGTIPIDKGNAYGIAIEAANNGTGEHWPHAQTDAYVTLVGALIDAYGLDADRDVVAHAEWTTRKVDPAGPSPWSNTADTWAMDAFRDDVAVACALDPDEEDEVTQDDIERIAEAVWKRQMMFRPTNKAMTAEDLLETTAHYACNADMQTRDEE